MDKYNIEPVITTDAHYKTPKQHELHTAIKSISFGTKYGESGFSGGKTFCLLGTQELEASALKTNITRDILSKAMKNTIIVADKVEGRLEKYETVVPHFEIPEGFDE